MGVENLAGTLYLDSNTNRQAKVHKKQQLITPSLRFPLQAGGTEPTRPTRFPSRSGGNLKEGGNCKLCPCDWYYSVPLLQNRNQQPHAQHRCADEADNRQRCAVGDVARSGQQQRKPHDERRDQHAQRQARDHRV